MFYYYGAKHRLARYYPAPEFPLIVEPFAGAAGYAMYHLERSKGHRAELYEKDPRVAGLWRRLLAMDPDEIERHACPDAGGYTDDYFVMVSAASNALANCRRFKVTPRALREFRRMCRRVARLRRLVADRVRVVEADYTAAPNEPATWFVDPPYQPQESAAKTANPGGKGYARGCGSDAIDYAALASWCASRQGQVIVAEYASATWLPFRPLRDHQRSDGRHYKEGFWTSATHSLTCDMGADCSCGAGPGLFDDVLSGCMDCGGLGHLECAA